MHSFLPESNPSQPPPKSLEPHRSLPVPDAQVNLQRLELTGEAQIRQGFAQRGSEPKRVLVAVLRDGLHGLQDRGFHLVRDTAVECPGRFKAGPTRDDIEGIRWILSREQRILGRSRGVEVGACVSPALAVLLWGGKSP
jgi:hypothetical protein